MLVLLIVLELSSAYDEIVLWSAQHAMSETNTRNKTGYNTEPWGEPVSIVTGSESEPPMMKTCFLPVR